MTDNTFRFFAIFFFLFSLWVVFENTKERVKLNTQNQSRVDSLTRRIIFLEKERDSLFNDLYPCEIELSRYENTYKIFLERNPKSAEQFGNIMSDETE